MNKKLRDRVLIIATIVTVICMLIGSFVRTDDIFKRTNQSFSFSFGADNNIVENIEGDVQEIIIDMDMADIVIEKGDENTVSITSNKSTSPVYTFENGVVSLTAEEKVRINPFGKKAADVTITLKDDVDVIDIKSDMASVEIKDVNATTFKNAIDLGDIKISGCTFENIDTRVDLGDMEVNTSDFLSGSFIGSAGDIEIELPFDENECSFEVDVELGDVTICDKQVGNHYQTNDGMRKINIALDMGDVEIK